MNPLNKEILSLAIPSILANITVPLVGMADIAVAGHLGGGTGAAALIGGITIGTMLFDLLYWNFAFLRSGTGGLTAQAYGRLLAGTCGVDQVQGITGVVAIGEIGLDYHEGREFEKEQKEVLRLQLELAAQRNLPVNIHLRDAWEDLLTIFKDCRHLNLRGNLHCFSGSYEVYEEANRYGDWSVGIGGVITFKNSKLAGTVARIPLHHILLETDAPYLAPVPHRGERNESSYLPLIAQKVAEVKGLTREECERITTENAERLFNI